MFNYVYCILFSACIYDNVPQGRLEAVWAQVRHWVGMQCLGTLHWMRQVSKTVHTLFTSQKSRACITLFCCADFELLFAKLYRSKWYAKFYIKWLFLFNLTSLLWYCHDTHLQFICSSVDRSQCLTFSKILFYANLVQRSTDMAIYNLSAYRTLSNFMLISYFIKTYFQLSSMIICKRYSYHVRYSN